MDTIQNEIETDKIEIISVFQHRKGLQSTIKIKKNVMTSSSSKAIPMMILKTIIQVNFIWNNQESETQSDEEECRDVKTVEICN